MQDINSIKDIMEAYDMNMTEISERFRIPYRTVQNWCSSGSNRRECPPYIIRMMCEILRKEKE